MTTFVLDPAVHTVASVPRFVPRLYQKKQYKDKHFSGGEEGWKKKIEESSTVYVGNLSCYTNEYQLYELFTRCGSIKRIIMGLDKIKKTPCGFCFVEFDERDSALKSISFINRTKLDGREIQVDIDAGFEEGRQYGRGAHGGQIGDERRREREQGGDGAARGGPRGGAPMLTRSIVSIVACVAMISLIMIVQQPDLVEANVTPRVRNYYLPSRTQFALSPFLLNKSQMIENREPYEKAFAQFLVNIMKAAKPTLLRAFISATLADKQLKEIAIAMFFNNTSTDSSDKPDEE